MIDQDKIKRIAEKAAKVTLGTGSVSSVTSAPILDSEGHDALRITIILTTGSLDMLGGDQLVDATVEIHDTLQNQGEERFPFVRFASEDELERVPPLDPEHLFEQASGLIGPIPPPEPLQANLRRAISAAYYALFHVALTAAAVTGAKLVAAGSSSPGLSRRSRSGGHSAPIIGMAGTTSPAMTK